MKPKHFLFGLFALMAASCTNDDLNEVAEMKQNGIQVTAGLTANTRVNFEQDGSVTHALWEENDQITLYAPSQGYLPYQVSTLSEDAASATFTPINDALQNTDETIYAAHRAGMEADIVDGMATLPNTDTWTDEHPLPFAYAISKVADGKLNLSFGHVFAYLKLTLNAETVAGSDVKEITDVYLTNPSGAPISIAAGRFDFSTQSIIEDKGIDFINYSLQESFTATGTAEKSIYIPILPQAAGETIHLAVLHKHEAGCDTLLTINKETPATGFLAGRAYTYSPKSPFFRDGNTITLTEAGTLSQAISEAEKYTITNLKIIGFLNGDDIRLIREMAGRDVEGNETEGHLTDLDISGATIVEGGGAYFIRNLGEYYNYEVEKHYTLNDVITSFMFYETILENISLPQGVVDISSNAFYRCSSLSNIVIPEAVTSIGDGAFSGCSSLTSIAIPEAVTSIGGSAFSVCSSLTSINISNGVTSIGDYAFAGCSSLTSINIPDGVTEIDYATFYNCFSLTSINIPDGVTSIGDGAFQYCSSLTSVTLGSGLTSIGDVAFGGTSLSEVSCNATTPPTLSSSSAFNWIMSPVTLLYVPTGCSTAYRESDWATYFSAIIGEDDEYVDMLVNGDAEGEDFSCFVSKEANGELLPSRVTEAGMGADGVGRAFVVISDDMVEAAWDTQFYIISTESLNEGDYIFFSMKYKADKEATSETQWHISPGAYIHWNAIDTPTFTTEWQEYNYVGGIDAAANGGKTIAFNLNTLEEANTYYFDDISLKVIRANE